MSHQRIGRYKAVVGGIMLVLLSSHASGAAPTSIKVIKKVQKAVAGGLWQPGMGWFVDLQERAEGRVLVGVDPETRQEQVLMPEPVLEFQPANLTANGATLVGSGGGFTRYYPSQIYVVALRTKESRALTPLTLFNKTVTPTGLTLPGGLKFDSPQVSPNGQWVIYRVYDAEPTNKTFGKIFLALSNIQGTSHRLLDEGSVMYWLSSTQFVYGKANPSSGPLTYDSEMKGPPYVSGRGWLMLYDVPSKTFTQLSDAGLSSSAPSPDGRYILVHRWNRHLKRGEFWLYLLADQQFYQLKELSTEMPKSFSKIVWVTPTRVFLTSSDGVYQCEVK